MDSTHEGSTPTSPTGFSASTTPKRATARSEAATATARWAEPSDDRLHCIAIASRRGLNIIFERFFPPEGEGAVSDDLRLRWYEALHRACANSVPSAIEGAPHVGRFEGKHIVWMVEGGVVLFVAGSGVYDEIALAEALQCLSGVLKLVCKSKVTTETLVITNVGKICLAVDNMVFGCHLDRLDVDAIYKSIKLKNSK